MADLRGYSYDRRDVTGRALANTYAQILGTIFSSGGEKPFEVEITVAEVGVRPVRRPALPPDLRRQRRRRAGHGRDGRAPPTTIGTALREGHSDDMPSARAFGSRSGPWPASDGEPREIAAGALEVAVLDRTRPRRTFRRLTDAA